MKINLNIYQKMTTYPLEPKDFDAHAGARGEKMKSVMNMKHTNNNRTGPI